MSRTRSVSGCPSGSTSAAKPLHLLYFAWVREHAGCDGETLDLPAGVTTVGALITWLQARGGGLASALADPRRIRVAVNQEHANVDHALRPGDEVAFFPPITGGAPGEHG